MVTMVSPEQNADIPLEKIELRGTGLKDGFRVNASSRDKKYDFMGRELDSAASGSLGIDKYY